MSQNIVAYSFVSEHSKHFFYAEKKTCILKRFVKWEIFFFVKSWAIVPRGMSKKKKNFFYVCLPLADTFAKGVGRPPPPAERDCEVGNFFS